MEIYSGEFGGSFPMAVIGEKDAEDLLILFPGLRLTSENYHGMELIGLKNHFKDLAVGVKVAVVGRPINAKEGSTLDSWLDQYAGLIDWAQGCRIHILGLAAGVPLALSFSARYSEAISSSLFIGGGTTLTAYGRSLYEKIIEWASEHQFSRIHQELAKQMQKKPTGIMAFLSGVVARAFSADLGEPENPLPFMIGLQAEQAFNGELALQNIGHATEIHYGGMDLVYKWPQDIVNPNVQIHCHPHQGYGLFKTNSDLVKKTLFENISKSRSE